MKIYRSVYMFVMLSMLVVGHAWAEQVPLQMAEMNPCGMKMDKVHGNPCNPCDKKGAMNPCMSKLNNELADKVTRPEGTELWSSFWTSRATLVAEGEKLFNDTSLGTNGTACSSCHTEGALFKGSFAQPYPHYIRMADERAGMKQVHADEIVQFCKVVPLAGDTFAWDSRELAALTAYVTDVEQQQFMAKHSAMKMEPMNPCNPCAKK